eukprot:GSChrysophyteH1.ASY1.ANO1.304.1 assembled CDS
MLRGHILCLRAIFAFVGKVANPTKPRATAKEEKCLHACALDHLRIVRNLTEEQLNQRYPMACGERWGRPEAHRWEEDQELGVPLSEILDFADPCMDCGADGGQFFSFCLNRSVNADRVCHCEHCGRCFYYRPGCIKGCEHCGMGQNPGWCFEKEEPHRYPEDERDCSIPKNADYFTRGLAAEGYWGW